MAVGGSERQAVDFAELLDLAEGFFAEGSFAFEGVEHDAFEEVSEAEVFEFGNGLQDFEQVLFDTDSGLDAFDYDGMASHGTNVPTYQTAKQVHESFSDPCCSLDADGGHSPPLRAGLVVSFR